MPHLFQKNPNSLGGSTSSLHPSKDLDFAPPLKSKVYTSPQVRSTSQLVDVVFQNTWGFREERLPTQLLSEKKTR